MRERVVFVLFFFAAAFPVTRAASETRENPSCASRRAISDNNRAVHDDDLTHTATFRLRTSEPKWQPFDFGAFLRTNETPPCQEEPGGARAEPQLDAARPLKAVHEGRDPAQPGPARLLNLPPNEKQEGTPGGAEPR